LSTAPRCRRAAERDGRRRHRRHAGLHAARRRRPQRGHARAVGDLHAGERELRRVDEDGVADRDAGGDDDYLDTPAAIVYGTALSTTQLNATVDGGIAGTLVYTPLEGVVLNAGTHELSVTFTPASANYAASTKTVSLTVTPAATTITWNTRPRLSTARAVDAQLNATVDGGIAGTLVYTPLEGVVLNAGTHELSVTFTPASANYAASTKTVSLTVTPAATTISWNTPAAIVYGTRASAAQLNATVDGGIAGTLVYTPLEGVVLNAGTHELSVTFTPASANYAASTKTVSLTVTPAATTITWNTPGAIVYGTALSTAQ
jgi:surface antigen